MQRSSFVLSLAVLWALARSSTALADPTPEPVSPAPHTQVDTCATSFPERLTDAKQALMQYGQRMKALKAAEPAMQWFTAHCRLLTELEIAIRKLDDPDAFVCDPKAKGKPKDLKAALDVGNVEPTVGSYQEKHGENHRCAERDKAAGRPTLIVLENASVLVHQEILCWDDERPICAEARGMIAAARAKGLE